MRVRTGIDVASIEDVASAIADSAMLDEHWTSLERAAAAGRTDRLAGQWAAKEAVMKALQAGIGQIRLRDIEIINTDGQAPTVRLYGSAQTAADAAKVADLSISITHERGLAAAVAVALVDESRGAS